MKKIFYLSVLLFAVNIFADLLECKYVHETITGEKGDSNFKTESYKVNEPHNNFNLLFKDKHIYMITKTDKQELIFISKGMGTNYFLEQTNGGNINLYTLFDDGTLTISKSTDIMGKAKINVQSILKCTDK